MGKGSSPRIFPDLPCVNWPDVLCLPSPLQGSFSAKLHQLGHKSLIFLSCQLSKDEGNGCSGLGGGGASTRVGPLVLRQRAAVAEALAALGTLRQPVAQVRLAVQRQRGAHTEGLATLAALVGLVGSMVGPVHVEVEHTREALAAHFAAVRLVICVRASELGEVPAVTEEAAALGT